MIGFAKTQRHDDTARMFTARAARLRRRTARSGLQINRIRLNQEWVSVKVGTRQSYLWSRGQAAFEIDLRRHEFSVCEAGKWKTFSIGRLPYAARRRLSLMLATGLQK
jgi:hypothetical protein